MRKNIKITLATAAVLASTALLPMAMPVHAADVATTATSTSTNSAADTQTVSMTITQSGTDKPSEAGSFLGKTAQLVMKDGKVDQVIIHVNGADNPMAKGQNMSKLITKLTINGVDGKQANVKADGSTLDFVFPTTAYKEGKGELSVDLNVMNHTMSEKADITFGAVTKSDDSTKTETNTTKEENTQTTSTTVTKKAKKAKNVKRTLKHNAYEYKKDGKRANKKVLKKGKKVTTYGHAIKLHGKTFYRISKNVYVKKANF